MTGGTAPPATPTASCCEWPGRVTGGRGPPVTPAASSWDWRGRVTAKFDADMFGTWKNGVGTLEEQFEFYDGKQQNRVWTLRKTGQNTFSGEAPDVIGAARGRYSGSALNMNYVLDLPVGDSIYQLTFDDWMWKMNDGVLINRAYMKKFGITVAELTVFMKKVSTQ